MQGKPLLEGHLQFMNKLADLYQKETPTQDFLVNIAKFSETPVYIQNTSRLLSLKTTTELNCHPLAEGGEYIKRYGERFPLDAFGNDQEDFICLCVKARTFSVVKSKVDGDYTDSPPRWNSLCRSEGAYPPRSSNQSASMRRAQLSVRAKAIRPTGLLNIMSRPASTLIIQD